MSRAKTKARRGRPSDDAALAKVSRARRPDVALSFQRLSIAVNVAISKKLRTGEPIPIELLGVARLCAEWHTDYLTVEQGTPTPSSGAEPTTP